MKAKLITSVMMAALLMAGIGITKAQEDADGCKDYPLFNRMPNYYLYSCEELEFSSMVFPIGAPDPDKEQEIKTETVEGKILLFQYALKEDAKAASGLQIMRNFQNALKQKGSTILGEYQGWCSGYYPSGELNSGLIPFGNGCTNWSTTFKFAHNGKEIWAYQQYSDDGYDIVIAEKEAMIQDIEANAMFDKINTGESLILYINFETGKSSIKADSQNIIDELNKMLDDNPALRITIEGHTDNVGNASANKTLSEQRALSVKNSLVSKGVSTDRIKTAGYGQEKPVADNASDDGKAKNRRVEIKKQ